MAQQEAEDRERALDLEADVIRAREGATAKAKAQAKNPPKKTGTVKKRKAAQVPTAASPSGSGRKK